MRGTTQKNSFIVSLRSLQASVWVRGVIGQVSAGENDKGNISMWKTKESLKANDQTYSAV